MSTATNEQIVIDADRALTLLREVVDERGPDTVYEPPMDNSPTCVYSWQGEPSCLVGQALHRAGVTVDELDQLHGAIDDVTRFLPTRVALSPGAVGVFLAAQSAQDRGDSWGTALRKAEFVAAEGGDDA